ncbi:MAG: stearoyl-CoA 9-desaturase oxidoreductase [Myxococcales bacterium]|nr:stearoyl-CoA 9-desaturase oxidoreductase [Myxococcales bacterium]
MTQGALTLTYSVVSYINVGFGGALRPAPLGKAWLMFAARTAAFGAARTIARRLTLDRQVDFWMHELDPAWSYRALHARVVEIIAETHDVTTFILAPNRLWPGHRAGQFVTVEVEVDGVRMQRCYSLSSAPGEEHVAITVKRVHGGRVSSWMHDRVRRGDVVRLGMPTGEFVLQGALTPKLLLVSGGSGVTPVMSILRDLSRRQAVGDVVFLHAARSRRDVIFERELEELAAQHPGLKVAFFIESDITRGGRLDRAKLRAAVPDLAERDSMLCGPAGMMEALAPVWTEAGIVHRLKVERFAPALRLSPPPGRVPATVKLALVLSGRTVTTERPETLLEQLERGGERPVHGCRMGICNTCVCRKRSGAVEDIATGIVSSEPDEDIRLCVSRARTDVELAL